MEQVPQVESKEVSDHSIRISDRLMQEAVRLLRERGTLEEAVPLPSSGDEVSAVLSPNSDDMIALREIEHNGKKYYLGIPKS